MCLKLVLDNPFWRSKPCAIDSMMVVLPWSSIMFQSISIQQVTKTCFHHWLSQVSNNIALPTGHQFYCEVSAILSGQETGFKNNLPAKFCCSWSRATASWESTVEVSLWLPVFRPAYGFLDSHQKGSKRYLTCVSVLGDMVTT